MCVCTLTIDMSMTLTVLSHQFHPPLKTRLDKGFVYSMSCYSSKCLVYSMSCLSNPLDRQTTCTVTCLIELKSMQSLRSRGAPSRNLSDADTPVKHGSSHNKSIEDLYMQPDNSDRKNKAKSHSTIADFGTS